MGTSTLSHSSSTCSCGAREVVGRDTLLDEMSGTTVDVDICVGSTTLVGAILVEIADILLDVSLIMRVGAFLDEITDPLVDVVGLAARLVWSSRGEISEPLVDVVSLTTRVEVFLDELSVVSSVDFTTLLSEGSLATAGVTVDGVIREVLVDGDRA